jgi:hypothetical protein
MKAPGATPQTGDIHCHNNLAVLLEQRGDTQAAEMHYRLGADGGDALALRGLNELFDLRVIKIFGSLRGAGRSRSGIISTPGGRPRRTAGHLERGRDRFPRHTVGCIVRSLMHAHVRRGQRSTRAGPGQGVPQGRRGVHHRTARPCRRSRTSDRRTAPSGHRGPRTRALRGRRRTSRHGDHRHRHAPGRRPRSSTLRRRRHSIRLQSRWPAQPSDNRSELDRFRRSHHVRPAAPPDSAPGKHIRKVCHSAASAMPRYPVRDNGVPASPVDRRRPWVSAVATARVGGRRRADLPQRQPR